MPGPFGVFGRGDRLPGGDPFAVSILFKQTAEYLVDGEAGQLGVLRRTASAADTSVHSGPDGLRIVVHGHCLDPETGRRIDAPALEAWRRQGDVPWDRLEGAFVAVIHDPARASLELVTDRFAVIPVYYHAGPDRFCFAPRLRYLPRDLYLGPPDPTSVIHFLTIGKYPGDHTPLAAVKLLPPASRCTVDLTTFAVRHEPYWNLTYRTEPDTPARDLVHDLGEAIEQATDLLTRPEHGVGGQFLSGGWDSRSILGATRALGRLPARAITNGVSDTIVGSDTWLAHRMADDLGIPYYFSRREPRAGADLWLEGLWLSEAATENSPGNFGIHRLPDDQFDGLDYMLKGDVTWGSGELAIDDEHVIAKNFPWPLPDKVPAVLSSALRADAAALYAGAIETELARCPNDEPADRQQWLWQMSGINRYIFGLGYFDEEYIQVRRPLTTRLVLDQWCRVPWRLRLHKNLFLESIHRRYPQLFAYGRNHVSHLADYYHHMAEFIRERTLASLRAGCDLDGLLDREACIERVNAFRPTLSVPTQPGLKARFGNWLRDRQAWRYHRSRWYREDPVKRLGTGDQSLVFRLYVLIEFFHHRRTDGPTKGA